MHVEEAENKETENKEDIKKEDENKETENKETEQKEEPVKPEEGKPEEKDFATFENAKETPQKQEENVIELEEALTEIERETKGKRETMMGLLGLVDEDLDMSGHLGEGQTAKQIESEVMFGTEGRDAKEAGEEGGQLDEAHDSKKLETLLVSEVVADSNLVDNEEKQKQNQTEPQQEIASQEPKVEVPEEDEIKETKEDPIPEPEKPESEKTPASSEKKSHTSDSVLSDSDNPYSDISGVSGIKMSDINEDLKNVESDDREGSDLDEVEDFTKFNSLVGRDGIVIDLNRLDSLKVSQEDHNKVID